MLFFVLASEKCTEIDLLFLKKIFKNLIFKTSFIHLTNSFYNFNSIFFSLRDRNFLYLTSGLKEILLRETLKCFI